MEERIAKTVLPNGVRVVTESIPNLSSVSIGIWVEVGSRDEPSAIAGASHFLEHLLFKGTEKRSALQISQTIDSVGGDFNAFTSREQTCYYIKVLGKDIDLAVDVLQDIFLHSIFDPKELEKERKVILQEIGMVEDTPEELVEDLLYEIVFSEHPLGRSVLGTRGTIQQMTRGQILGYVEQEYSPDRVVIAAAGDLEHKRFVDLWGEIADLQRYPSKRSRNSFAFPLEEKVEVKDLEQSHLALGMRALPATDSRRFTLQVLSTILGGGSSSRLFQEVRERRGLVYSICSYSSAYSDTGLFGVYAGTSPEKVGEVMRTVEGELMRMKEEPISDEELSMAKNQIKGQLLLSMESSEARMDRLARSEIYFGRPWSLEEIQEEIDGVNADSILELSGELFGRSDRSRVIVGPELGSR